MKDLERLIAWANHLSCAILIFRTTDGKGGVNIDLARPKTPEKEEYTDVRWLGHGKTLEEAAAMAVSQHVPEEEA
jgi:hypothetical protein